MKKIVIPVVVMASMLLATSCKVDQTKEAELPEVEVDVESGTLPKFDVDWADIDISTRKDTITVPKVMVVMDEVEVEVPYIDVDMPNDDLGPKEEKTLRVEAEVDDVEHTIKIDKVLANKNNMIVVAALEKGTQSLGDKKIRISDQVTINAPDLNVKYYIIGERPDRVFNKSYRYVGSEDDLQPYIEDYKVIYEK